MGAGNVLPTLPTVGPGAPSITDLNNLSYAASFLIDHSVRPTWKFVNRGSNLSVSANTWTAVTWETNIFDSDGVAPVGINWNNATIVTQGYYHVEAAVQPENLGSRQNFVMAFKWTAGSSSPYTGQSPAWFGFRGTTMGVTGSGSACQTGVIAATTPVPMYPGDQIQVMTFITAAAILEDNDNAGQPTIYMNGRVSMQFTGRWLRVGS